MDANNPTIQAATLEALLGQLQAAQPHDKLQNFTLFIGGRCMATFHFGTITFENLGEVERFLDTAAMAKQAVPAPTT